MNTVAFFCNAQILPGFHAALTSLIINHHSQSTLNIILFADKLNKKQQYSIIQTFNKNKKSTQFFEIREAPEMKIMGANSLVGNFTTYGRLFLSDLLQNEDLVLYLDSDIIVNYDVSFIFNEMKGDYTLFVSGVGERNWSLDKKLYENAKLDLDGLCFNAGILGINLKKWRKIDGFKKCLDTISLYPNQFLSADQALLNVTFNDDFLVLPENINIGAVFSRPINLIPGIYHFVGLPKPWHILMHKYHKNYFLWHMYIEKSALKFNPLKFNHLLTFLRQIRSYYKAISFYYKKT